MFVKGIALTALVASTPLALVATQDPRPTPTDARPAARSGVADDARAQLDRANQELRRARAELQAARDDVQRLRDQLDAALDRIDQQYEPQRDRNCSPSRGRALMTHYQWLREQGHQQRAAGTLSKVVEQVGEDPARINSVAWDLMTEKETAGKFDEVALALAQRMEQHPDNLHHNHLDTVALAHFLNGHVDRACELQQLAIDKGGRGDDFRRRLRTYEAARSAVAAAQQAANRPNATMVATNEED